MQRKPIENKLHDIFQQSPFPWWEWEVSTNTVKFSNLKASMIGYDPQHFHGRGYQAFTELLHPDDYEKAMDAMRRLLFGETELYQIDYRILARNDQYHWYMDRGIPSEHDNEGKVLHVRGIVIDLGREALAGASEEALVRLMEKSVIKTGKGTELFLTICSSCKRAKLNNNEWIPISSELAKTLTSTVSHGICPECVMKLYPDMYRSVLKVIGKDV